MHQHQVQVRDTQRTQRRVHGHKRANVAHGRHGDLGGKPHAVPWDARRLEPAGDLLQRIVLPPTEAAIGESRVD
eukprot:scaffold126469_cov90-Phaeocystis_antarctica.AAC.6